jgi:phage terminase large subunit
MFNEATMVQEVTKKQLQGIKFLVAGGDYGQMNATTFEVFGIDFVDKCLRGFDEYYYSGRDEGKQKSPSEYAQEFKKLKDRVEKETGKKLLVLFLDPSAKGLAEEIKQVCPDVNIPNAENDVALGISRVQKLMSYMRHYLSPKQKHLISERYQYEYDKDKLDKGIEEPIKLNDHCSDAERYLVMGVWKYIRQLLPHLIGEKD